TGSLTVSGSMSVTVSIPAGVVPAGTVANVCFATTAGSENVACGPAAAGVPTRCIGSLAGEALQGSAVRVFAAGVQVALGRVVGPGVVVGVPPLLPPLLLPPPPAPLVPLPAAPGQPEVPVIPEAAPLVLVVIGLAALGALRGARRR